MSPFTAREVYRQEWTSLTEPRPVTVSANPISAVLLLRLEGSCASVSAPGAGDDAARDHPSPRRDEGGNMRPIVIGIAIVVALASMSATAYAQSWRPPADNQRCPSKWGA